MKRTKAINWPIRNMANPKRKEHTGFIMESKTLHTRLNQLLELAGSADRKSQNEALVDIALILERSQLPTTWPDKHYQALLPPDLLSIRLEESMQREIVDHLSRLATTDRIHPTMVWAIGKSAPRIGIGPLLMLLRTCSDKFDQETTYQALITLDNFMVTKEGIILTEISTEIRKNNSAPYLEDLSRSQSPRIATLAQRVLLSLRRKL